MGDGADYAEFCAENEMDRISNGDIVKCEKHEWYANNLDTIDPPRDGGRCPYCRIDHLESLLRRFCKHFKDCDDCPIWEEATCPMPTALLRDFTDAAIEGRE